DARLRRARNARARIREKQINRLCVFRSPRHMYAQIFAPGADGRLFSHSSLNALTSSWPLSRTRAGPHNVCLCPCRAPAA
ncbi:MAG: hypothetical protein F4Z61_04435, partial [Acidimicrobiia bacterium]|nr:hypothetical protein [Acidimicrobiia bacterium]